MELQEPTSGPIAMLAKFYLHHILPRLGALLSGSKEYRYLQQSIAAFPAPKAFAALMRQCPVAPDIKVKPQTFGSACLYFARLRP